jgi:ankyrin repeat protein
MSDKVFQVITAASKGSLEELKKAFESGLSPSSVMDYDRRTPLHLAAAEGHLETVKYLLEEKKVDINVTDRYATKFLTCNYSIRDVFNRFIIKDSETLPCRTQSTADTFWSLNTCVTKVI